MSVAQAIDVSEILLNSPSFGPAEIEQIEEAVASDQCQDVRTLVRELQQKVDQGDSSKRNLLALGITCYLLARHTTASGYLAQVTNDGLAEYYHALALMAMAEFEDAFRKFGEAAQHGMDPMQCHLLSVGAIRLCGRLDEAEALLRSTGREGTTRAEYSYQWGCLLADRGDTYGAIEYFERAVDMDPRASGALFRLAGQNNVMGNDEVAITLYEQSLSKPPFFLGALMNLGLLYEDKENYAAAAFCFKRVLEIYPNHERAKLYLKDIEASGDMYYDEEAFRRDREMAQTLETPITDFELSARSRNCLENADIHTLGDLARVSEQELLAGKNFGETSLREVRIILEARGLRIGQNVYQEKQSPAFYDTDDLSPEERELREQPVAHLDLSVRARKCLARLGITSVRELVVKSADELLSVRNFGVTSLNEIRARLADHELSLRKD